MDVSCQTYVCNRDESQHAVRGGQHRVLQADRSEADADALRDTTTNRGVRDEFHVRRLRGLLGQRR